MVLAAPARCMSRCNDVACHGSLLPNPNPPHHTPLSRPGEFNVGLYVMWNVLCEYKDTEGNYCYRSIGILCKTRHYISGATFRQPPLHINRCQSHQRISSSPPPPPLLMYIFTSISTYRIYVYKHLAIDTLDISFTHSKALFFGVYFSKTVRF